MLIASSLCFSRAHRDLPSFPTRRSSDLNRHPRVRVAGVATIRLRRREVRIEVPLAVRLHELQAVDRAGIDGVGKTADRDLRRSEEHTSELQSPYDLVCRLLLEKKKKKRI